MAQRQEFETIVRLNAKEAEDNVERLRKKIEDLKAARDKAISSKGDSNFIKDLGKDLKAAQAELKNYESNVQRTIRTVKDVQKASLGQLETAVRSLRKEMRQVNNPEDYAKLDTLLRRCKTRMDEIKASAEKVNAEQKSVNYAINRYEQEIEQANKSLAITRRETALVDRTMRQLGGASMRELEYSLKIVNERLRGLSAGTAEFKQMTAQARQLRAQLNRITADSSMSGGFFGRMADAANRFQALAVGIVASLTGMSLTIRKTVQDFAEMEEAMANTRKYTGQTDEEVRRMNEDFKRMDTRTSREELNALAGAAGRLGITSTQSIEEFVDAADKIGVALGDDLGEGAVDQIGKLAMAFGEDDRMGLRGAMLATGSAVNELAQNSASEAGYLVDFTARVAGVGKQLNMTQADILSFAAVMDENLLQDEMSSTAFNQLLTNMASDTKKFAQLAGMDMKQFADLVKNDANEAVLTLLDSMKSQGGFEEVAKMFNQMGMDGTRAISVLTTMSNKVDDIRKYQNLANEAYEEGTSVINEFNVQNNTVQAGIDKAAKGFKEVSVELGEKLLPVAKLGISTGSLAVKALSALVDIVTKYGVTLATLTVAITALVIAKQKDVIVSKLQVLWNEKVVVTCKKLWATLVANPYLAVAAAVGVLIALLVDLARKQDDVSEGQKALNDIRKQAAERMVEEQQKTERLIEAAKDENISLKERKAVCEQLNKIIPNFNAQIDESTGKFNASTESLKKYNDELMRKYELEGAKDMLAEIGKERAHLVVRRGQAVKAWQSANALTGTNNSQSQKPVWARSYNAAETNFVNANLEKAKNDVVEIDRQLAKVKQKEDAINKAYGERLRQETAAQVLRENTGNCPICGHKLDKNGNCPNKSNHPKGNGGNNGSDNDSAAVKEKRKEAKAIVAEEKAMMAELAQQYAQGEITYSEYLDRQAEIAQQSVDKRKALWKEGSAEYNELLSEEQEDQQEHQQAVTEMTLREIERRRVTQAAAIRAQFYDQQSEMYQDEDALNEALFQNDMEAQRNRLNAYAKGTKEWFDQKAEMEQAEQEHALQLQEQYQERLQRMRERYGRLDISRQEEIAIKGLEELHRRGLVSEEEYQRMLLAIRERYADMAVNAEAEAAARTAREKGPGSKANAFESQVSTMVNTAKGAAGDAYDPSGQTGTTNRFIGTIENYRNTMEQLRQLYANDAANYNAYQAAKRQVTSEFLTEMVQYATVAFNGISQVMGATSSYYAAQSQYEQNVTTKKYDKMIEAAGNNTAKQKKLEDKKQKELAKIKTRYNKKQMKIEIAQAFASTALAAINAYASAAKEHWLLGAVAAAMATAAGMIQIATIKKQHAAEEQGYYEGGFTGGRNYRREAGVVHEGEFVANHQAVNNQSILPALRLIDMAQRNNTVGSLTAADVSRSLGMPTGGGTAVVAPVVNVSTDNEELRASIAAMNEATARLNEQLRRGIKASVSIDGQDGVRHQLDLFDRLRDKK